MKPIRDLRAYGDDLVKASSPTEGGRIAMRAMAQPSRTPWVRRAVVALTSLAVFSGANIGMALAANSSVPGDRLYGIDRAYERVAAALGIHTNTAAERFEEAAVLSEQGHFSTAFETASEATHDLDNPGLSHALAVLEQLSVDTKDFESDDVPPGIQRRLNDQAKALFGIGQEVSTIARGNPTGSFALSNFEKHSDLVLKAVRDAQKEMKDRVPPGLADKDTPPGQSDQGPPGLGSTLPSGQDKDKTP